MKQTKRILLASLFSLTSVALAAGVFKAAPASAVVYTAEEIFSFRNVVGYQCQSLDDANRSVLSVTSGSGGEIAVNGRLSGAFSWEVGSVNVNSYTLVFTDAESGNALTIDARAAGSKAALSLSYAQAGESAAISSVTVQAGSGINYIFDPAEAAVKAEDSLGMTYEFAGPTGLNISGFERYRAELKIVSASGEGKINIYSLCGYDCITESMYDSSRFKPSVYVKADAYAVAGEAFALPRPYASVLGGEEPDDITVAVFENGREKLAECAVGEAAEVVFGEKGSAEIVYTATAKSGNKSVVTLPVSVLEEGDVYNTFAPDGSCGNVTVGTSSEIILPYVVNSSTLNSSVSAYYPSCVRVTDSSGNAIGGWDGKESGKAQTVRFSEAGEYTVTFTDRSGKGNVLSYKVTVDDELAGIDGIPVEEFYECASEYALQPASLYYKGESRQAEVKAISPDGREFTSGFAFDMGGIYRLIYSAELGGEERSVELRLTVYERADASFSFKTSSVFYEILDEGNAGVAVLSVADEYVVFERSIDLSSATVDTEIYTTIPNGDESFLQIKDRDPAGSYCLIDFNVVNSDAASLDFSRIYIRVTDAYDSENYFEIRIADGAFAGAGGLSYIRARAVGQSFSGMAVRNGKYGQQGQEELKVTKDEFNESGGFLMNYGFQKDGSAHERLKSFKIYYDNQEKALFAVSGTQYGTLVCDFDDPRFSSSLWGGFTTGEAILSIRLGNIGNSGKLIVYSVGDYDLTSEYLTDNEPPVLTLDKAAGENAYALIGRPFPVFKAQAADKNYSEVVVKAYLGGEEVPVTDGYFVPEQPAVYTLVYYAVDAFGNKSAAEYVSVRAQSTQTGITLRAGNKETVSFLGRTYVAPEYEAIGASGGVNSFLGYRLKGSNTFIQAKNGRIEFPEAGTYEILYKVTDYLSQSAEDFYEVVVSATDVPVVQEAFGFYAMMFTGSFTYEMPFLPACVYTETGIEEAEEEIFIYDGETLVAKLLPYESWSPAAELAGHTLVAKYKIAKVGRLYEYSFDVRAKGDNSKEAYFSTSEGVVYSETNSTQPVFTMTADGGFAFEKELLANNFGVAFWFSQGADSFAEVTLTLTDSRNPSEILSVVLKKQPGGVVASADGANWYNCSGDWSQSSGVAVCYLSDSGRFTDGIGLSLGSPAFAADGKTPFAGFSSGRVYFSLGLSGVTSSVSLCLTEINNQQMSMSTDRVAPELFVKGTYPGYDLGDTVTVFPAVADDVLNQSEKLTVSVYTGTDRSPVYVRDINGIELKEMPADREYYFKASDYASYTILYSCNDTSDRSNRRTETRTIVILDKVAPQASLTQSALTVKAGQSVELRALLILSDNITPIEELTVDISVRQNRLRTYANDDGTYTFGEAGKYYVDYLIRDSSGNLTILTLVVNVQQ